MLIFNTAANDLDVNLSIACVCVVISVLVIHFAISCTHSADIL